MSREHIEGMATRSKRRWMSSPPPGVGVEINRNHVTALSLAGTADQPVVAGYAAEPLPAGAVEPALNAPNIHDRDALVAAVRAALDKLSLRSRRVALVLPDTIAKVSLLRFEKVPARMQDLEQLIRWQVRKAVPFRVEDAQVSWIPGLRLDGGGREFIVTVVRRDIVESYEQVCDAAGAQAGIVDLASFNLINAGLAATGQGVSGDWLLVHVAADYATLAVVRGPDLVSYRNRASADPKELIDLVHQTAMYHEDRLGGGGFSRVFVAGVSMRGADQADWIRRSLDERLGAHVEMLDFRTAAPIRDRISVAPELIDALAPALGVLLRERVA